MHDNACTHAAQSTKDFVQFFINLLTAQDFNLCDRLVLTCGKRFFSSKKEVAKEALQWFKRVALNYHLYINILNVLREALVIIRATQSHKSHIF